MAVSYNKLWKILIDRKMKKKDLAQALVCPSIRRGIKDFNHDLCLYFSMSMSKAPSLHSCHSLSSSISMTL